MITRPYRKINNIYVPLIRIEFANPDNVQINLYEYSLLNTGADVTLIPYFLIQNLNLPRIREENRLTVRGFNDNRLNIIARAVSFSAKTCPKRGEKQNCNLCRHVICSPNCEAEAKPSNLK